jgi:hypothetical protein
VAELWVTTRTYRGPCNCRDWKGPQQQQHKPFCPSMTDVQSMVTFGLKTATNDRLWQIWVDG